MVYRLIILGALPQKGGSAMREKLESALALLEKVCTVITIAVAAVRKIASVWDVGKKG